MATNETIDPRHPLGTRPQKPVKPKKPKKTGHKLRNTLLALAGAGILGGGAYALLSDSNDTKAPQTPVPAAQKATAQKAAGYQAFPAFNPGELRMNPEIYQAYNDLRSNNVDPRFPTEQFGNNPLFLNMRQDLYNRMVSNLQSGGFKTVNDAFQDALNTQFSVFKNAIENRQPREYRMVVGLPMAGTKVGFNMVDVANQIMTYKMAHENKQWVHQTHITPLMKDNTLVWIGRTGSAMAISAAFHMKGYSPEQALKVMALLGPNALDPDLQANAINAQRTETKAEPGIVTEAFNYVFSPNLDAHDRYVNTLKVIKDEIEHGTNAFDATISATNQYKTAQSPSFAYRFAAASDLLAGKTKAEQLKALDTAISKPNIIGRAPTNSDFPWKAFVFAGAILAGGVFTLKIRDDMKAKKASEISADPHHDNTVIRKFRKSQNGLG